LVHKTQDEDNPETLVTFGTQETGPFNYMSKTVGVLKEAGTAYPAQTPGFSPGSLAGAVLLIV
jgi:hypothetical protein